MSDRSVPGIISGLSIRKLLEEYDHATPDLTNPAQKVSFGTSGHRGTSLNGSFTRAHILAITQAVCDFRTSHNVQGPLYIGKDTHALSEPAMETALEVLAANKVHTIIQEKNLPTPTPVISRAIIAHNRQLGQNEHMKRADGIVVTPSHNPPEDGGFKYNEYHGGPAGTEVTRWIEDRANTLLAHGNKEVKQQFSPKRSDFIHQEDLITLYVTALSEAINMSAIASSGIRLGVDPLGGASLPFWEAIGEHYALSLTLTNTTLDPLFSFMPPDHDGKTRMDCSSPWAMAGLISLASSYDLAFANDPDADRHGIVTPEGLMPPNNYLCTAVWHLLQHRKNWQPSSKIGKTTVSTSMLDKVCQSLGRSVYETPVGFKWFVPGLTSGKLSFGGEESAGASFLRQDGSTWTTDKDGLLLCLLAAEMTVIHGKSPARIYSSLTDALGTPYYARIDAPVSLEQKKAFSILNEHSLHEKELAGSPITQVITKAPGDGASIGGIKVITKDGWFAARPSGTENIYKIYAESFISTTHLEDIQKEAKRLVERALDAH